MKRKLPAHIKPIEEVWFTRDSENDSLWDDNTKPIDYVLHDHRCGCKKPDKAQTRNTRTIVDLDPSEFPIDKFGNIYNANGDIIDNAYKTLQTLLVIDRNKRLKHPGHPFGESR